VKDLWTERRALWVDAALAVAALASLLPSAADPQFHEYLALRMAVLVFPLLIAIRRIEPMIALPGLVVGAYLAGLLGQPVWFLYGAVVLALWSLAGRCGVWTTLGGAAASLTLPILLDLRPRASAITSIRYDLDDSPLNRWPWWPWWLSVVFLLLTLVFLAIRRRTHVVPARQQWAELRTFLREPHDAWIRNLLIALTVSALIMAEIGQGLFDNAWWSAPQWMPYGVAAAGLTLVFRRRPVIPVLVLAVASLLSNWQSYEPNISLSCAFGLALYWLVVSPKRSRSLRWTLPLAITVLTLLPLITRVMRVRYLQLIFPSIKIMGWDYTYNGVLHNRTYDSIAQNVWPISFSLALLLPVLAAIAVRQYRRNREAARREAELEQAAELLEAEQVILTERATIARDLHDVVAHAVNLMVIQAETGPDLVRRGEADVLAGFQRIGDAGRRALTELDRLLSTLRDADGIADPQLAPQPGLSDLPQLVADASGNQLPIELDLQGDLEAPPEGQQVTAYRLVQEALTNVVKHARATGVRVAVRSEETGVRVEVTDDGIGFDVAAARRGNRHGLAGMRERVRIEGGTLDIRSTPGAGTTVDAWMPVGGDR